MNWIVNSMTNRIVNSLTNNIVNVITNKMLSSNCTKTSSKIAEILYTIFFTFFDKFSPTTPPLHHVFILKNDTISTTTILKNETVQKNIQNVSFLKIIEKNKTLRRQNVSFLNMNRAENKLLIILKNEMLCKLLVTFHIEKWGF